MNHSPTLTECDRQIEMMGRDRAKRSQRGQVLPLVAATMAVLVGFAGLAIDSGGAYDKTRFDQNVADAAALAGSLYIYANYDEPTFTNATAAANRVASDDGCSGTCSISYTFLDASGNPAATPVTTDRVQATVSDRYSYFLINALLNATSTSITRTAQAKVANGLLGIQIGYPIPCQICLLQTSGTDLTIASNGVTLSSSTGDFDIDADASFSGNNDAVTLTGNHYFNVTGAVTMQHPVTFSPAARTGITAVADPISAIAAPSTSGTNYGDITVGTSNVTTNLTPGVYGTISLTGTGDVLNFSQPGTYIFAGGSTAGLQLGGSQTIVTGTGVTMYFTCGTSAAPTACASGQQGATISFTGQNSQFNPTSPTSGTYYNILIFFDRQNASPLNLTGNSLVGTAAGALYAVKSSVSIAGNSGTLSTLAPIICATLAVTGNGFSAGGLTRAGSQPIPGGLYQ